MFETKLAKNHPNNKIWVFNHIFEKRKENCPYLDLNQGPLGYEACVLPLGHAA